MIIEVTMSLLFYQLALAVLIAFAIGLAAGGWLAQRAERRRVKYIEDSGVWQIEDRAYRIIRIDDAYARKIQNDQPRTAT